MTTKSAVTLALVASAWGQALPARSSAEAEGACVFFGPERGCGLIMVVRSKQCLARAMGSKLLDSNRH